MNIVTIHPAPKKPLTFADIKPGPFIYDGDECTKFHSELHGWNAVRRCNGYLLVMCPDDIVTLPDAPPPQDTVAYRDLDRDEMFTPAISIPCVEVWKKLGDNVAVPFHDGGRVYSFLESARVRRVDSVTITRDQQGAK